MSELAGRIAAVAARNDEVVAGAHRAQAEVAQVAEIAERTSSATEQVSSTAQQTTASGQEIASAAASPRHDRDRARHARRPLHRRRGQVINNDGADPVGRRRASPRGTKK